MKSKDYDPYVSFLLDASEFENLNQVADANGIPYMTLHNQARRGVRDIDRMVALAKLFRVSIDKVEKWISTELHRCAG